jgi:dipeptidyl aminopeptidase/acylaminoacyl peptidase
MDTTPPFTAERLINLRRVSAVVPSPDGSWLAVAVARHDPERAKYVSELWRVTLDGLPPLRLTRGTSNDRAPCFRRDGALGFLSDRPIGDGKGDDDTRAQVWVFPVGGGEPVPLTDEPLGVNEFAFAREGDRLIALADVLPGVAHEQQRERERERVKKGPSVLRYTATPTRHWDHWRSPAAPHVIAYDSEGNGRRDLTPEADADFREECEWSLAPDGSTVAITSLHWASDRIQDVSLVLIDTGTHERRVLVTADRESATKPVFSRDGRRLACVRHGREKGRHGKPTLWCFDLATGHGRALGAAWDAWPSPMDFTRDGRVVVTVEDRGTVPVFTIDPIDDTLTRITRAEDGGSHEHVALLANGSDEIIGLRHRTTHPPEVFRALLKPDASPRLVTSLSGFTEDDAHAFATVTSHAITATDGASIQSFVMAPRALTGPAPTLVWIHGGPMSQWADAWHWRWNALVAVAQGYVVALPNPRGSTGRGQDFLEGIWNNTWGAQCYLDVMSVTEALAADSRCDGARVAAMGGSFGGYMTNWIGGSTDRFRCLVTHASVYAQSSFGLTTDHPPWWYFMMGCTPYDASGAIDRYSPHRQVAKWRSPTLVIHGERDYRVAINEALMLFEALQHHGVPSELMVFPDEGHWILKPRNAVAWYEGVLDFLARHLKP